MIRRLIIFCLSVSSITHAAPPEWLWVYSSTNFQVEKSVNDLIALMERSKKAGYSGILINDFKFGKIDDRPGHFYKNLERTRAAADRIGIELIPGVMPIGYSSSLLINNPHLAAGIPVRDCEMVVKSGRAEIANSANMLKGGAFEQAQKHRPTGWGWIDGFGNTSNLDTQVKHGGKSSVRMENFRADNKHGNCRVSIELAVKPWHQYQLSFWAKTENVKGGEMKVAILSKGKSLSYTNAGMARTQNWKQHHIVFNTFEHSKIALYIGIWNGDSGKIWLDDAVLTETAGINMLRRKGCPVTVTSVDGKTVYQEGRDFEKWIYPKMGADPYPGSFKGTHPPPLLRLTKNSRIKDGQKLNVSFYHTVMIYDHQVACCLIHDEVFTHLTRQIALVNKYLKPKTYFMNHDEIRVAGYCELCKGRTSGQLLAENARRCVDIIKTSNPKAEILVWNDMFDPFHNARDGFYLTKETMKGSWDGLDKSVVIANWNGGKKDRSIKFFADRGHRQLVAGYYDNHNVGPRVKQWTDAAARVDGVIGYMYTTWRKDYSKLEAFADEVRKQAK
jgi:hypothetical protein